MKCDRNLSLLKKKKHVCSGTIVKEKSLVKLGTPATVYHVTTLSPPFPNALPALIINRLKYKINLHLARTAK